MREQREREVSMETEINDGGYTLLDLAESESAYEQRQQEYRDDHELLDDRFDAIEGAVDDPAVLTGAERAVTWLRLDAELESREITQVLSLTPDEVSSLVSSATKKLKSRLVPQVA